MPRRARSILCDYVYHVLNRSNARQAFPEGRGLRRIRAHPGRGDPPCDTAEPRALRHAQSLAHGGMASGPLGSRGLGLFALADSDPRAAMARPLPSSGSGHLYQGRYKSFPVESDEHLYTVLRYVERNPLRANLVERAQDWRWSSLGRYTQGDDKVRQLLAAWPIPRPKNWASRVNRAEGKKELEAVRRSVQRGQPYGSELWCERIVQTLGLESTVRPRGRPRKTAT